MMRCLPFVLAGSLSALATADWQPGPTLPGAPAPRLDATGLVHDGIFYALGGSPFADGGDMNAAVHLLPSGAPAWSVGVPVEGPVVRQRAGVDALGRVIVFGGRDGTDPEGDTGKAFVYELVEGQQNDIAQRTEAAPIDFIAGATDDAFRVYSIGGGPGPDAGPGAPNAVHVERYDGLADTWTPVAAMPNAVAGAAAVNDGQGHLLVIGGFDAFATARTTNVAQYDVAMNTWSDSAVPDLPVGLTGHAAVCGADGRIYVLGGTAGPVGAGIVQSAVYVLDAAHTAWLSGPDLATPRTSFAAGLGPDDLIYAAGGWNEAGGTALVETLYTPPCPTFVVAPPATQPWTGMTAVLGATVGGGTPMTFRWQRDGIDLDDGPAPGGGVITGAFTMQLRITSVTSADDGVYTLSAMNGCGTTTSPPAVMTVRTPPTLAPQWTATNLHPGWAVASAATAVSGDRQGGFANYDEPPYGAQGHPTLWTGTATSAVNLTPSGSVGGSIIAMADDAQVGWWWWPYACYVGGQWQTCYSRQAARWAGDAASHDNLQVSGWEYSIAADTDGIVHVGTKSTDDAVGNTFAHAGFWGPPNYSFTDLHPAGVSKSAANAIDNGRQYGSINTPYPGPVTHAAMWSGSAASFTDLHPAGASRSWITAAGDGQQVGSAYFGDVQHVGLWSDAADSFVDFGPGTVNDCDSGLQVGALFTDGATHAVVWSGRSDLVFDLQPFVPAAFTSSVANAIDVDDTGRISVVGSGYNGVTQRQEALLWRPVVCVADVDGDGVVAFSDLLAVLAGWGPCAACPADVDGDGTVGFADVLAVLSAWGACP